jgi:hypothetical protein
MDLCETSSKLLNGSDRIETLNFSLPTNNRWKKNDTFFPIGQVISAPGTQTCATDLKE